MRIKDSDRQQEMDANGRSGKVPAGDFADLVSLAVEICGVPVGLVSIRNAGKHDLKASFGLEDAKIQSLEYFDQFFELPIEELIIIPDTKADPRLNSNSEENGVMGLTFFAGFPLKRSSDKAIGMLCIFDREPRSLSARQIDILKKLARQASQLVELEENRCELQHVRETFQEEIDRLVRIIDTAEVGLWELEVDSGELRVSEKWAAITGYSLPELGEITRQTRDALVHPDDLGESERVLADYLAGTLPRYECELRMKHKRGYWVWVLERGELGLNPDGKNAQCLFGTLTDTSEHIVAYEQIYLREKKFKILLENSEDAIVILNEEGRPHFETESVSKILGLEWTQRSAEPVRNSVHPDDLGCFDEWFQESLQKPGKAIKGNVSRLRHSDGSWRYLSGTLTNFFDNPIINGVIYNFKDASEQILAEERRKRTENRYRKLAQEGADLVCVVNEKGVFDYLSPNFQSYLGRTVEELLGKNAFEFIHPDDVGMILSDFQNIRNERQVRGLPFRFRHQADGWRWVQSVATSLLDDHEIQGVVVNSVDVTAVIDAKTALEQSNERFKLALKAGSESIYDFNPITQSTFISKTFEEDFGIKLGTEVQNFQLIRDRIHPEDLGQALREFSDALDNPNISTWTREYRLLKGDGTYAYIRDKSIKQTDKSGRPIRVVGAMMDMTQMNFFEKLHDIEKEFIESSLVTGTDEKTLYRRYLLQLESLIPGMKASILRLEDGTLRNFVSPSLSEGLIQEMENIDIGPNQGSCGTAAYLGEKVLVTDVFHDPRWKNHHELAKTYGIGACWSFPILNADGRVVATIANYYSTVKKVEEKELRTLERAQRLISLLMAQFDYVEKIRLGNERYELVNKSTNEAIFDWDVQKDKFYWGESLRRVFGHRYSADDFNLETWTSLMHPTDNLKKAAEWNSFLADPEGRKWQNQFRFLKADGSFAFVEESAYIIRDERGNPVRMIGVLRDRTELKKMEMLLTNASHLSRVGGWEVDLAKDRLLWSPITCEIHEVPADFTASAAEGIAFYREDYRESVAEATALAIKTGKKFDLEAPIVTAAGEERWVRAIGEAELLNGQPIKLFGSIQDIHERKLMEERLKGVSDSIPGLIFQYILKPGGSDEFRYVSKGSIQLLGLTPEECMADSDVAWSRLARGGDLAEVKKSLEDSAATLSFWNWEWRVLSPEGRIRWREGRGTPSRRADGSVVWDALVMDVTDRKNLENLLDQSAKMAKIGSWELDLTRSPLQLNWSSTTRSILGFNNLSGVEFEKVYQVCVGESRETVKRSVGDLIQSGAGFDVELEMITGSGKPRWIRCIGQAVHVNGKILSAFGSVQDIHERKLSELKLKRLLLERNTILESIGDGFFAVDSGFVVTYWNNQAEKLLHIPREAVLGKNLWDSFKAQESGIFRKNFQSALETEKSVHFEGYLQEFKVWFSISAFPSESGLTVYFKDITENKNAQEEIRDSNDRFEWVSEATNDAIWDLQLIEDKLYWGKGFMTRFGYDLENIEPNFRFYLSRIHPQDRNRIEASLDSAKNNPKVRTWNQEYRFQKADGSYAYVMDRAIFSRNLEGKPIRIIAAMSDITHRKEFEESLKELNVELKRQAKELAISNSGLEQFAYVASHDLQEPLRMVSSFLSLLDRKYRDRMDEKAQQYIHFAVDGAIRMRQIILDLLEYSKVGKGEKETEEINLEEVVFEVTQLQSQLIEEKNASIRFEGQSLITSFKSPILQVFQNLIGNALKYSKEGVPPVVVISCREEKNQWLVEVRDNGIGVKEEYFDKIFVIFQRLHSKEEYTGTGLGLAIVKKIIEALGGKIWVESVYSQGTTFFFTIPKPAK